MSTRWNRRLLLAALVLAVVVVGASSYLRLAGNGLGCMPWPVCYGTAGAFEQANQGMPVRALRVTHRVAASAFLLVALGVVAIAWRGWSATQRTAGAGLVAVALVLAVIGRFTPSGLPWITWTNVLGGFLLIGLSVWLLQPRQSAASGRVAGVVLLALLVGQVLGGTLISSRLAAAECAPACVHEPRGHFGALWDPRRSGNATEVADDPGGAGLLHLAHRMGGLTLALLAIVAAPLAGRAAAVGTAAGAVMVLGVLLTYQTVPAIGAMHALAAAWLIASLAPPRRPRAEIDHKQGEVR
jgi:cytochrome c oxidase assembly protein subunit 15